MTSDRQPLEHCQSFLDLTNDFGLRLAYRCDGDSLWLILNKMAGLCVCKQPTITKHLATGVNSNKLDRVRACSMVELADINSPLATRSVL